MKARFMSISNLACRVTTSKSQRLFSQAPVRFQTWAGLPGLQWKGGTECGLHLILAQDPLRFRKCEAYATLSSNWKVLGDRRQSKNEAPTKGREGHRGEGPL